MDSRPKQPMVARLKKEEEESWISEEDLYTEGSSDDDQGKGESAGGQTSSLKGTPIFHQSTIPELNLTYPEDRTTLTTSEPAMQDEPHLAETTRRLSLMGVEDPQIPLIAREEPHEEIDEQEEVMLWRPKRGSIKLPHHELDHPPSPNPIPPQQVTG